MSEPLSPEVMARLKRIWGALPDEVLRGYEQDLEHEGFSIAATLIPYVPALIASAEDAQENENAANRNLGRALKAEARSNPMTDLLKRLETDCSIAEAKVEKYRAVVEAARAFLGPDNSPNFFDASKLRSALETLDKDA